MKNILAILLLLISVTTVLIAGNKEVYKTNSGDLTLTMIGWSGLQFEFKNKIIYVDPSLRKNSAVNPNYDTLAKADYIFITHSHFDHFNIDVIKKLIKPSTQLIVNNEIKEILGKSLGEIKITAVVNNKNYEINKLKFNTVPAYNLTKDGDKYYHPLGVGNGFVFDFGGLNVFVAGDTENIPELKKLQNIDIAFLPLNRPYTMDDGMFINLVLGFKPKIVYPYHYDDELLGKVVSILQKNPDIELKVRTIK